MRIHLGGVTGLVSLMAAEGGAERLLFRLTLRGNRFEPAELAVPANRCFRLAVANADTTAVEFESRDLGVEKVIGGRRQEIIAVGPLKPGRYAFEDEFHRATAQGVLVAEAPL